MTNEAPYPLVCTVAPGILTHGYYDVSTAVPWGGECLFSRFSPPPFPPPPPPSPPPDCGVAEGCCDVEVTPQCSDVGTNCQLQFTPVSRFAGHLHGSAGCSLGYGPVIDEANMYTYYYATTCVTGACGSGNCGIYSKNEGGNPYDNPTGSLPITLDCSKYHVTKGYWVNWEKEYASLCNCRPIDCFIEPPSKGGIYCDECIDCSDNCGVRGNCRNDRGYCWGYCGVTDGWCPDGYDEVPSCYYGGVCSGFSSAPLCKRRA